MSGVKEDLDEFGEIARLFRSLTGGAPEALDLLDDAAVLRPPPGEELVVTTDTIVEGVHFLPGTPSELVARRLLRVNLSDLAAKAAEPWLWQLAIAWPPHYGAAEREAFAAGLADEQARFGLRLVGGDTVRTPGPLVATATLIGRAPEGGTVRRSGARPGDVLLVSGTIGDAGLGLDVLRSGEEPTAAQQALVERHRLPSPRLELREALRAHASAAADVSDGLLADAGRIGIASGAKVSIPLERLPLSTAAADWVGLQADAEVARLRLATSGDDYEIVCTARPDQAMALQWAATRVGTPLTPIGDVTAGAGVDVAFHGRPLIAERLGWVHG